MTGRRYLTRSLALFGILLVALPLQAQIASTDAGAGEGQSPPAPADPDAGTGPFLPTVAAPMGSASPAPEPDSTEGPVPDGENVAPHAATDSPDAGSVQAASDAGVATLDAAAMGLARTTPSGEPEAGSESALEHDPASANVPDTPGQGSDPPATETVDEEPRPVPIDEEGAGLRLPASPALPPFDSNVEWLKPVLPLGQLPTGALLFLALLSLLGVGAARRVRDALPERGALPRLVGAGQVLLQVAIFLLIATVVGRQLERSLGSALAWLLIAVAIAIGWGVRDVLPDLVAGIVLAFERRVRPGIWVHVAGHSGLVEQKGLRAVWLRDNQGHRVALPNRLFLGTPLVAQHKAGPVHEVTVRLETDADAKMARQALQDAVLTSPWVQPKADPQVRRHGTDPHVWHVRARLLDMRFAMQFDGDLLERAEDILRVIRHTTIDDDDWD